MITAAPLFPSEVDAVVDVFSDAFHDYPVMRWVVGPDGDVPARVRRLISLFVTRRVLRGGPMLGVTDDGRLVAAAILTLPVEPEPPAEVAVLTERAWHDLGTAAQQRYEAYALSTSQFFTALGPHHHLNMIGVRPSHAGRGLARPLLDAVAGMCDADPGSAGVSLTTEREKNVSLYRHFGYTAIAHQQVGAGLETWGMVRRRA